MTTMAIKDKYPDSVWYTKDNYTAYYTNGVGMVDYSDAEILCKDLPQVEVYFHDSGMVCTHNMPCAVCKTNHAVFMSSLGYFYVCHKCSKDGYEVVKWKKPNRPWHRKLVEWMRK